MASTEYHGKYKKLFPGVLSSNSFLTVYILHMLNRNTKMYGKEIVDSIGSRLKGLWVPSHGLVYPLLRKLEAMGFVVGVWEGRGDKKTKRYYEITDLGREALVKETKVMQPMLEDARHMIDYAEKDFGASVNA